MDRKGGVGINGYKGLLMTGNDYDKIYFYNVERYKQSTKSTSLTLTTFCAETINLNIYRQNKESTSKM